MPSYSCRKLHSVYGPYDGNDLLWHPVCKEMSNPAFQGPRCAEEMKKPAIADFFSPISKRKKVTIPEVHLPLQGTIKEEEVQVVKKEEGDFKNPEALQFGGGDQGMSSKKRKVIPGQRNIDSFFSKNSE